MVILKGVSEIFFPPNLSVIYAYTVIWTQIQQLEKLLDRSRFRLFHLDFFGNIYQLFLSIVLKWVQVP